MATFKLIDGSKAVLDVTVSETGLCRCCFFAFSCRWRPPVNKKTVLMITRGNRDNSQIKFLVFSMNIRALDKREYLVIIRDNSY